MNLQQLQERGAFVGGLVPKDVTWKGETFTVNVVRMSFGDTELMVQKFNAEDEKQRARAATFIAAVIRLGDDASEVMTYEQAYGLDVQLATEFIRVANEVTQADREKN